MMKKPFRSYIICTAPRSGSTLLCKLLAATDTAGNPDSHFHSSSLSDWLDDYGLERTNFASERDALRAIFMAAVARGKGDTDIFGLRIQQGSFDYFLQQLELLLPGHMSGKERIEAEFGPTLFVHLTRQDRLDQAISRVRAEQTGLWHRNSDGTELERLAPPQEPRYDPKAINHHMEEAVTFDEAWEKWFEREAVDPFRVNYDALSKDPQTVLAQLLSALNLDPAQAKFVEVPTAKLADALSSKWRDQFESEN